LWFCLSDLRRAGRCWVSYPKGTSVNSSFLGDTRASRGYPYPLCFPHGTQTSRATAIFFPPRCVHFSTVLWHSGFGDPPSIFSFSHCRYFPERDFFGPFPGLRYGSFLILLAGFLCAATCGFASPLSHLRTHRGLVLSAFFGSQDPSFRHPKVPFFSIIKR